MRNNDDMREVYRDYCRRLNALTRRIGEVKQRDPTPRQKTLEAARDDLLYALSQMRRYVPDEEARAIIREVWEDVPDEGVYQR